MVRAADNGAGVVLSFGNYAGDVLHFGQAAEKLRAAIMAGRSIALCFPEHRVISSAIVAGIAPIAVGLAMGIKRRAQVEIDRADDELMLTFDAGGGQILPFGLVAGRQGEALTVPHQEGVNPSGLTQEASVPNAPAEETPDEAQMRWYAEEAERAAEAELALREQEDGEDRLFLMMRAEQDELERKEQEESDRRKAM